MAIELEVCSNYATHLRHIGIENILIKLYPDFQNSVALYVAQSVVNNLAPHFLPY